MLFFDEMNTKNLDEIKVETIKTNKKVQYINLECALDIETTSTMVSTGKFAFMYVWQIGLGLDNDVYYGRTWDDLLDTLEKISKHFGLNDKKRMVFYVHNLSYEFQFMRKYFNWDNIFAVNERKPIKALCDLGIEFRDSYILSGYSLENTAKNLTKYKVNKLVGDLDYSLVRTHHTPLTEKELNYCENDILVILSYIKEQIEQYTDISKIPLTNTGRVRNYVRNNCYYTNPNHRKTNKGKYSRYSRIMKDLTLDLDTYKQCKRAFMGGFTHSSPLKTNEVLEGVDSIDLTSSYPTVMLSDKFPMSRGRKLEPKTLAEFKKLMKQYCLIFDIRLTGVKNKIKYESYISESKCFNLIKPTINNGRVFEAESLTTTITDVDFNIIEYVYSWENIEITNVIGFFKNYLPKQVIESILNLYEEKTTLKGVEGKEVEYLLSKGMLNSVYGMCVTDFVKDDHVYNFTWTVEQVDPIEKLNEYNQSKTRFLYYPWGIFITAYARRNLWSAIINVKEDYIYSDTDSVKMLNYDKHQNYIEAYNQQVTEKLNDMMKFHKLDPKRLSPKTITGIEKPLGVWEHEGHYTKFKTLGAKRYLVEENGKYYLTVAGLSKKNGINYMINKSDNDSNKIFDMFNNELYIPAEETGKMTHTYLDKENEHFITDYRGYKSRVNSKSSIHLENCDFTLSISTQFSNFLEMIKQGYIYKGQKIA